MASMLVYKIILKPYDKTTTNRQTKPGSHNAFYKLYKSCLKYSFHDGANSIIHQFSAILDFW